MSRMLLCLAVGLAAPAQAQQVTYAPTVSFEAEDTLVTYPVTATDAAVRSIPSRRSDTVTEGALPEGAHVAPFDRAAWLSKCRARLATYPLDQQDRVLAALGGAALGYRPGHDGCETYLDSYIAGARSGTIVAPPYAGYGETYMLVPVDPEK